VTKALLILAAIAATAVAGALTAPAHAELPQIPPESQWSPPPKYWTVAKMNQMLLWSQPHAEGLIFTILRARCTGVGTAKVINRAAAFKYFRCQSVYRANWPDPEADNLYGDQEPEFGVLWAAPARSSPGNRVVVTAHGGLAELRADVWALS
jgi:hypothetical protein